MIDRNWNIPKGSLISFSTGEYSDYGVMGFFVTLEDLTLEKVQTVKNSLVLEDYDGEIREKFVASMIRAGYLLGVQYTEYWLGSYGELHIS